MITMIVFVTRKTDLSYDEFSDYWLNRHAPLVKSVPEFMRHVRKYVQHHRAPGGEAVAPFGDSPDYDGVGEIWFDSREAMKAAFEEPRYLEVIRPDEKKFFDASRCLSFIGDEHIMTDTLIPTSS
ncbi:EthD domain-containing protein [Rhizorhabdus histidinilytica]|uniref:EthD domain-containing protein n=2 Tax=Rhizorhabdus histidinilytica TaxID=439228 RepID=A0A1T5GUQ4_9SPHN|nr:EthD domain-containing protein [Rhizorhabdus histidinilytica]SKC12153.1 conserved hypothetical protein [Rhizorhabdus histidinilytica]